MKVHVIGGGLAGLAAAVGCAMQGTDVALYESAPRLGGRCATFVDRRLGISIDNGTHVVIGTNSATMRYLAAIGSLGTLVPEPSGKILMRDIRTGDCFPATSRLSWRDAIGVLKLAIASSQTPPTRALSASRAVPTFWQPLATAALNTTLAEADSRLLWRTARKMFDGARQGPTPLLAGTSLAATYVDPAAAWLTAHGATLSLADGLVGWQDDEKRITDLVFESRSVPLAQTDVVIVALPFWSPLLRRLGIDVEGLETSPIVNVTYVDDELPDGPTSLTGVLGGVGQWLMRRGRTATVTVSAADQLIGQSADVIAATMWREIADIVDRPRDRLPQYRVVKERRATLKHTPAMQAFRPGPRTRFANLILAGDWVSPDLPCTIESAVTSGWHAAASINGG